MTARILVVDDVPTNAKLLESMLHSAYYQVAQAHEGMDAIHLARSWKPDLVLLDVLMPGLNGYEICRMLKKDQRTYHIPVVMLTALHDRRARLLGLEAGADDFLTKPVDYTMLLARTRALVRLKQVYDGWRARGDAARALGLSDDDVPEVDISRSRALVLDDDPESLNQISTALAADGITSVDAVRLDEPQVSNGNFDLVVINLALRASDPLSAAARIRADPALQNLPLLLVADPVERDRSIMAFDIGVNDWVLRPIDEAELRARARNQIRRKRYHDALRSDLGEALALALTDELTGLYNQRYLLRRMRKMIAAGAATDLAVLIIDIDFFKAVNDRWGHAAGDMALRAVAQHLRAQVRTSDDLIRYGGEEFVLLMQQTDLVEAVATAERLRTAVENMAFEPQPGEIHHVTISVGVALSDHPGEAPDEMLFRADQALYAAKRGGRNRVEVAKAAGRLG